MTRLSRKAPDKDPATIMIVVTERKKTEPVYLETFKKTLPRESVFRLELEIVPGVGVPMTVVNRAIQKLENLKNSQESLSEKDSVWAMFDRDEHPKFDEAKYKAKREGVHLAVSNPCFEIWGIYHYQDWEGPIGRDQCQKRLEELCPSYDRKSGKIFEDQDIIKDKYCDAIRRAEKSLDSREQEGDPEGNPSTSVHRLINAILSKVKELKSKEPCQAIEGP
ncbi:MAG: RloB domain-containing protein [Synechococcus sp. SB0678_bin_12]|nr:RloB domain-containing protein [Synechococcus sp. SB0678_bin_12]